MFVVSFMHEFVLLYAVYFNIFLQIYIYIYIYIYRGVLKTCRRFTGQHPCRSAISIKLQSITLPHGFCPVNLLHIFRTRFSKNTFGRLLLYMYIMQGLLLLLLIIYIYTFCKHCKSLKLGSSCLIILFL